MAIKKQAFYEGAALHLLIRTGATAILRYEEPFFLVNNELLVYLKYSTKNRSPWGFTFTRDEQMLLQCRADHLRVVIGLICGADGVATLTYENYRCVASSSTASVHLACYRKHGERYEVSGPDGRLTRRVAPANWQGILKGRGDE
jgi:hypothetical protein